MNDKIRVGITHGDINGICYEIIIKTFMDQRMSDICTPIIYGSSKVVGYYKKNIPGAESLSFNLIKNASEANSRRINIINCIDDNIRVEPGKSDIIAGQAEAASLNAAVRDIRAGLIDVLVTAPINKANIQCDEFDFTGHTEFLDANFHDTESLMMMVGDTMRVGLATIHIPLSEVATNISSELILKKLRALKRSLVADFGIRQPKIAVLSLNPHAGDDCLLGSEEKEIITPAIISANDEDILAFGPFAADGFFGAGGFNKYDAVLAMYHDQGLAPFKALCQESGVNFTAGLSIVRTSPAHGVGYDIAGKNMADPSSFRAAIYSAVDIWRNRNIYKVITANPLKHYAVEGGADVSVKDIETEEDKH
ncbi:MAG: 4-hydroxythreonine-4-phosphate dehydrogenase PdxA [Rikenellaceae bacterium]|nr:4-hydroxythreonine-4-phosphate dehydrogenase PdxA [Rikenellaceae bacterium]